MIFYIVVVSLLFLYSLLSSGIKLLILLFSKDRAVRERYDLWDNLALFVISVFVLALLWILYLGLGVTH